MKNCTPLWREAHFEVKSVKNWRSWTTFRSWDVQKVHAVVAQSTFRSQHVQSTPFSKHFWKLRCTAHFQVKMLKTPHARTIFEGSDAVLRDRREGFRTLPKVSKTWRFLAFPKTMAGVGHVKRICKDAFRVAGAIQETYSSEMWGGQGADFLRSVAFLEHQIFRFAKMILRLRMTWHHFFVAGAIL